MLSFGGVEDSNSNRYLPGIIVMRPKIETSCAS